MMMMMMTYNDDELRMMIDGDDEDRWWWCQLNTLFPALLLKSVLASRDVYRDNMADNCSKSISPCNSIDRVFCMVQYMLFTKGHKSALCVVQVSLHAAASRISLLRFLTSVSLINRYYRTLIAGEIELKFILYTVYIYIV